MSTLKTLRQRINGVKSTQKITQAMKLVSSAKLITTSDLLEKVKIFDAKTTGIMHNISNCLADVDKNPLIRLSGADRYLLVVCSSDRGLCGSFNNNIIKKTMEFITYLQDRDLDFGIICVGRKIYDRLKINYKEQIIEFIEGFSNRNLQLTDSEMLANKITQMIKLEKFNQCHFIYTDFVNVLKQQVYKKQLLPIIDSFNESTVMPAEVVYEYEPDLEKIIAGLLKKYLVSKIHFMLLDTIVSENGARMNAMDTATKNAKEMIEKLTLVYNRSRQAAITKELIEIISSAEVV